MDNFAIEVKDLKYRIDGRDILNGVNLQIKYGEIVGVIGASGSGKSTLVKCMAGLLDPNSGSISLNGRTLTEASRNEQAEIRRIVGYVFQYSALFDSMTVFENIALAPMRRLRMSRSKARELATKTLDHVMLSEVLDYYPNQLSGGMAKRVGLARALAMDPKILFYDEPTSGLDAPTARSIDELILNTRRDTGLTSLVISHDLQAMSAFADRIALLENGTIALIASSEEFMSSELPSVRRFLDAG